MTVALIPESWDYARILHCCQ